ncbi:MAG: RidA family protein, partial [Pseudomonadales bacterium]
MGRQIILPDSSKATYDAYHFAPGVRVGDLVVLSGQIGIGPTGAVPEAAAEEFRNAWQAIGDVLMAANLGFDSIIEYTTFHVGLREHLATFMQVRDEFISAPWPAWTAIGVSELAVPGARVEIRVMA